MLLAVLVSSESVLLHPITAIFTDFVETDDDQLRAKIY